MIRKLITEPTVNAVSLDDINEHLRIMVTDADHGTRLTAYLSAAVAETENRTGRALITQTWDLVFRSWDELLSLERLPMGELQGVTHIKYQDEDNVAQTISTDDYIIDGAGTDFGNIVFHSDSDFDFPTLWEADPITVRIVCGYGDKAGSVPAPIQSAIKLMVSDMDAGSDSSLAIDSLLMPYRLWEV